MNKAVLVFWGFLFSILINVLAIILTAFGIASYSSWWFAFLIGTTLIFFALSYLFPVLPGRPNIKTFAIVMTALSIVYGFLGTEWVSSMQNEWELFRFQKADEGYTRFVSGGPIYIKSKKRFLAVETKEQKRFIIKEGTRVFLTGEEEARKGQATMVEFNIDFVDSKKSYWVPAKRLSRTQNSPEDDEENGRSLAGKSQTKGVGPKVGDIIRFSPAEIAMLDEVVGDSQTSINLGSGLKGKTLVFEEKLKVSCNKPGGFTFYIGGKSMDWLKPEHKISKFALDKGAELPGGSIFMLITDHPHTFHSDLVLRVEG